MNNKIFINFQIFLIIQAIVLFSIGGKLVYSQPGKPYLRNFSPTDYSSKEYDSSPQNFSVIQDKRGIIYVANSSGILEFDGITWQLIEFPPTGIVRSLAMDSSGVIFVGGEENFGFLAPDSLGKMTFNSYLGILAKNHFEFKEITMVLVTKDGVYFCSERVIYRINKNKILTWYPKNRFLTPTNASSRFFIQDNLIGLKEMKNDSLTLLPYGSYFNPATIHSAHPVKDGIIFLTREKLQGTFFTLLKGNELVPIFTDSDTYLQQKMGINSTNLFNNELAIATFSGGCLSVNPLGEAVQIINKNTGILTNASINLFSDNQEGLWLTLDQGLSRVEYPSPLSFYNETNGYTGIAVSITRHNGILYLGTTNGVYYLDTSTRFVHDKNFLPISNLAIQTFAVIPFGEYLLAGTVSGLYRIKNLRSEKLNKEIILDILHSKKDPNRIFLGLYSGGILSLMYKNNNFISEGNIIGVQGQIRGMCEDSEGTVWACSNNEKLYRINFRNDFTDKPEIDIFDISDGLPKGKLWPNYVKGIILLGTSKGIFYFSPVRNKFLPILKGGNDSIILNRNFENIVEDNSGRIWAVSGGKIFLVTIGKKGNYLWDEGITKRIPNTSIWTLFPDKDGIIWAGTTESVIRIDTRIKKNIYKPFQTLIRKVSLSKNRILFYGDYYKDRTEQKIYQNKKGTKSQGIFLKPDRIVSVAQPEKLIPMLSYNENNLTFDFAACSYDQISENLYSHQLYGYDKEWSDWSGRSTEQYTNLDHGNYLFKIKSKNIYGVEGYENSFAFTILPPFYKTWWFYSFQIIFIILLFLISIHLGRSGNKNRIAIILATLSIIILFEYFNNYIEDNLEGYIGRIMVLKVFLNVLLASLLIPLERIIKKYIIRENR